MRNAKLTFSILTLILSANIAFAETKVATVYRNYPVHGNNIAEIKHALLSSSLKDEHGNNFSAKTSPKFAWKYNFSQSENGCSIKSVDVEVQITYQLPELASDSGLSNEDKAEWTRFSATTYQHEKGHADLSIKTAKEIEWEAKNMIPKSSCGEVARTANMLISNILNRHEISNLKYDTQTAHGVKQGAVFASR